MAKLVKLNEGGTTYEYTVPDEWTMGQVVEEHRKAQGQGIGGRLAQDPVDPEKLKRTAFESVGNAANVLGEAMARGRGLLRPPSPPAQAAPEPPPPPAAVEPPRTRLGPVERVTPTWPEVADSINRENFKKQGQLQLRRELVAAQTPNSPQPEEFVGAGRLLAPSSWNGLPGVVADTVGGALGDVGKILPHRIVGTLTDPMAKAALKVSGAASAKADDAVEQAKAAREEAAAATEGQLRKGYENVRAIPAYAYFGARPSEGPHGPIGPFRAVADKQNARIAALLGWDLPGAAQEREWIDSVKGDLDRSARGVPTKLGGPKAPSQWDAPKPETGPVKEPTTAQAILRAPLQAIGSAADMMTSPEIMGLMLSGHSLPAEAHAVINSSFFSDFMKRIATDDAKSLGDALAKSPAAFIERLATLSPDVLMNALTAKGLVRDAKAAQDRVEYLRNVSKAKGENARLWMERPATTPEGIPETIATPKPAKTTAELLRGYTGETRLADVMEKARAEKEAPPPEAPVARDPRLAPEGAVPPTKAEVAREAIHPDLPLEQQAVLEQDALRGGQPWGTGPRADPGNKAAIEGISGKGSLLRLMGSKVDALPDALLGRVPVHEADPGLTPERVDAVVKQMNDQVGVTRFVTHRDTSTLPDDAVKKRAVGYQTPAFTAPDGTVHIITPDVKSIAQLQELLSPQAGHETVVHAGLATMPEAEREAVLSRFKKGFPNTAEFLGTEEALANLAERTRVPVGIVQKAVSALRQRLDRPMNMSDVTVLLDSLSKRARARAKGRLATGADYAAEVQAAAEAARTPQAPPEPAPEPKPTEPAAPPAAPPVAAAPPAPETPPAPTPAAAAPEAPPEAPVAPAVTPTTKAAGEPSAQAPPPAAPATPKLTKPGKAVPMEVPFSDLTEAELLAGMTKANREAVNAGKEPAAAVKKLVKGEKKPAYVADWYAVEYKKRNSGWRPVPESPTWQNEPKTATVNRVPKEVEQNAPPVRTDQGQVPGGREVAEGSEGDRGGDVERKTSEGPEPVAAGGEGPVEPAKPAGVGEIPQVARELLPLPAGWTAVVGKTSRNEGKSAEAEVDWQGKRIVFSSEANRANPSIHNHEVAHVLIETLPREKLDTLLAAYVEAKRDTPEWQKYGSDWITKNNFHREEIAVDAGDYFTDPGALTPEVRALFDRHFGREAKPAGVGEIPAEVAPPSTQAPTEGAKGRTSSVRTPTDQTVDTTFEVHEASDLIPSHRAVGMGADMIRLEPHPQYAAGAEGLQPRDRERAAPTQQVNDISKDPRFDDLADSRTTGAGAPIVGPDLRVEDGNGRVAGIAHAYAQGRGGIYRQRLIDNATQFGLDPTAVAAMKQPVLVRKRTTPLDREARFRFAEDANKPFSQATSVAEQARSDARRMSDQMLSLFVPADAGPNASVNQDFVRKFISDVLSPTERAGFVDENGFLSQAGVDRINSAILAKAYGYSPALRRILESTDDNTRAISAGMAAAAPRMAVVKAEIAAGRLHPIDPSEAIGVAADRISSLRKAGKNVLEYIANQDLFAPEFDDTTAGLIRFFEENKRSGKAIGEFLNNAADMIEGAGDPRQGGLLDEAPPTVHDILTAAERKYRADHPRGVSSKQLQLSEAAGPEDGGKAPRGPGEGQGGKEAPGGPAPGAGPVDGGFNFSLRGIRSRLDEEVAKLGDKPLFPQAALNRLIKAGVKPEEIQDTKLEPLLKGTKPVTREEIQQHIAANRVGLNEERLERVPLDKLAARAEEARDALASALEKEGLSAEEARDHALRITDIDDVGRGEDVAGRFPHLRGLVDRSLDAGRSARHPWRHAPFYEHLALEDGKNYAEDLVSRERKDGLTPEERAELTALDKKGLWEEYLTGEELSRYDELSRRANPYANDPPLSRDHFGAKGTDLLLHRRSAARQLADGRTSHHIEEIQSDVHQLGKEKGYGGAAMRAARERLAELEALYVRRMLTAAEENELRQVATIATQGRDVAPDVPHKKSWEDLDLKLALRDAVDDGRDAVTVTTGEAQIDRYPGMQGPEGMREAYDRRLPVRLEKIARQYDPAAKVYDTKDAAGNTVHALDITPAIREGVQKGQYQYSARQEETPEFKRYYDGSVIRDSEGRPIPLYHGTVTPEGQEPFWEFKRTGTNTGNDGYFGDGYYFTGKRSAAKEYSRFGANARTPGTERIVKAYVALKNPFVIEFMEETGPDGEMRKWFTGGTPERLHELKGWTPEERARLEENIPVDDYGMDEGGHGFLAGGPDAAVTGKRFSEVLKQNGHDGVVVHSTDTELTEGRNGEYREKTTEFPYTEVVAFDPRQIKSYDKNRGAFDPTNPDIRYSVRRANPEVDDMVRDARTMEHWKDWYDRHQGTLRELFGDDAPLFNRILAATSSNAGPASNVGLALKAYEQLKRNAPFDGYLDAVKKNLERVRQEELLRGPKIGEFDKATGGNVEGMAIDRHVAQYLFGTTRPTSAQHRQGWALIRAAAKDLGWEPRQTQAALWAFNQELLNQARIEAGKKPKEITDYAQHLEKKADQIRAFRSTLDDAGGEGAGVPGRGEAGPRTRISRPFFGPDYTPRPGRGGGEPVPGETEGPRPDERGTQADAALWQYSLRSSVERLRERLDPLEALNARGRTDLPPEVREILARERLRAPGTKFMGDLDKILASGVRFNRAAQKGDEQMGLRDEESVAIAMEAVAGAGERAERLWEDKIGPILKRIYDEDKDGLPGFTAYLIARQVDEASRVAPDMKHPVSMDSVQRILRNPEMVRKYDQAAKDFTAAHNEMLDFAVNEGILSSNRATKFKEKWLTYAPLHRIINTEAPHGEGKARPGSVEPPFKKRTGSDQHDYRNVLLNSLDVFQKIVGAAETNRVARLLADGYERDPERAMGLIEKVGTIRKTIDEWDQAGQIRGIHAKHGQEISDPDALELSRTFDNAGHILTTADRTFRVWAENPNRPGEIIETQYKVHPDIWDAMKGMDPVTQDGWVKWASLPARMLKAGTVHDPVFFLWNFVRDMMDATMQSESGFTPIDSLTGLIHAARKDDVWKRWQRTSSAHSTLNSTPEALEHTLRHQLPKSIGKSIIVGLMHPVESARAIGRPFEEAARVGEFVRALKGSLLHQATGGAFGAAPVSEYMAGHRSRNVTTDFAMHGSSKYVRQYAMMTAFFNPALQSTYRTGQAMGIGKMLTEGRRIEGAKDLAKYLAKGAITVGALSAYLWFNNRDDEEINELRKTKAGKMFWYVRVGDKHIVRIPKPFFGGQLFGTGAESVLDALYDKDPRAFKRMLSGLGEQSINLSLPNAFSIPAQLHDNKDWFSGTNIVPQQTLNMDTPLQVRPETSEVSRKVGDTLGLSPAQVEWLSGAVGGSLFRQSMKLADLGIEPSVGGEKPTMKDVDVPFIGRALQRSPTSATYSSELFSEQAKESEKAERSLKEYGKRGDVEHALKYVMKSGGAPADRAAMHLIQELHTNQEQIRSSPALSGPLKRALLDMLTEQGNRAKKLNLRP